MTVMDIADEVRLAYQSMVRLGEKAHRRRAVTLPMRAVLEYLDRNGRATVPGIARDRGVTRSTSRSSSTISSRPVWSS